MDPNGGVVYSNQPNKNALAALLKLLILLLIVCGLVFLGWKIYRHYHPQAKADFVNASEAKKRFSKQAEDSLKNKDYSSFESIQESVAQFYLAEKNFKAADEAMAEVFKNVPSSKTGHYAYYLTASIKNSEGDKNGYKYYLQQTINRLKAEGLNEDAAAQQKLLDSIK